MSLGTEDTANTSEWRNQERIQEPNHRILHEIKKVKHQGKFRVADEEVTKLTQKLNHLIKENSHVIPQRRILLVNRKRQYAHPVMKRETLEHYQQRKLGVWDLCPTMNGTEFDKFWWINYGKLS